MDYLDMMDLFFSFEIVIGIIGLPIAVIGFIVTLNQLLEAEED